MGAERKEKPTSDHGNLLCREASNISSAMAVAMSRCLGAGQGQPPFSFGAVTMGQEALLTTCLFTKELSQKAALLQVTQGIY